MSGTPRVGEEGEYPTVELVARRVPEQGWALFDKATDEKVDPAEPNAWWATRKAALGRLEARRG